MGDIMIKLLIADDEPLVCVGIRSMLKWEDLSIEICGTARNGQQAMNMIEEFKPEIVITDIKMPIKSGLELAEECNKKFGRVPLFIILTSFEEFEYVRRALVFQAVDYLVKLELTAETLSAAVKKALVQLNEIQKAASPETAEKLVSYQSQRDNFFIRLCNNLFKNPEQFRQETAHLRLDLSGPFLMIAYGEITGIEGSVADSMQMLREMLEKIWPCYISPLETCHSKDDSHPEDGLHFIMALRMDDPENQDWRKRLEESVGKPMGIVRDYFNVSIRMAGGLSVDNVLRLEESYQSARRFFGDTHAEYPLILFPHQNYKQQIVTKVADYIRHNLDKQLSLSEVAVEFNVSPNYLSQLFTRFAGEGFVEYITAARISAAKEMLVRGEGPVYEIAEKLGFESAFYFSRVFKKVEGISPREFMHQYEKKRKK
jgi:two-component system response regulator YesN